MGELTLEATVPISWQLKWWILSQGAGIEVLGQVFLREEIAATLTQAKKQYC